jgi:hypothetical protein
VAISLSEIMASPHDPDPISDPIIFTNALSGSPSNPTTGLTGAPNNPLTPAFSNQPALSAGVSGKPLILAPGGNVKTHHWIWIGLIVVALIAAYFIWFQPGA